MGIIDDYWEDITIYYVEFTSHSNSDIKRKHRKTLAFNISISKENICHLVAIYFNNIDEVIYVDEVSDGLLLKGNDLALASH